MVNIIFSIAVLAVIYGVVAYPLFKIRQLQRCAIVRVEGVESRYPSLPLGTFGLFYQAKDRQKVRVIFPRLTEVGEVEYIYSWHPLQAVHPAKVPKVKDRDYIYVTALQDLAPLIYEHLEIEPEIGKLQEEYYKLRRLADLVATSDLYAEQEDVYNRALVQVKNLLAKAEQLEQVYVRFVREVLIGSELAAYNPDLLEYNTFVIDEQYQRIKAEYQHLKDVAIAYADLRS
jgi:hypothetical protein